MTGRRQLHLSWPQLPSMQAPHLLHILSRHLSQAQSFVLNLSSLLHECAKSEPLHWVIHNPTTFSYIYSIPWTIPIQAFSVSYDCGWLTNPDLVVKVNATRLTSLFVFIFTRQHGLRSSWQLLAITPSYTLSASPPYPKKIAQNNFPTPHAP
jgi:hypothetical protein